MATQAASRRCGYVFDFSLFCLIWNANGILGGHEGIGTVFLAGQLVTNIKVGDHVGIKVYVTGFYSLQVINFVSFCMTFVESANFVSRRISRPVRRPSSLVSTMLVVPSNNSASANRPK